MWSFCACFTLYRFWIFQTYVQIVKTLKKLLREKKKFCHLFMSGDVKSETLFTYFFSMLNRRGQKKKPWLWRNLYFHTPALLTSSTLGSDFNLWGMRPRVRCLIPPFRRLMRPPTRTVSSSQLTTQLVRHPLWRLWIGVGVSPVCLPIRHWMGCLVRRNVLTLQEFSSSQLTTQYAYLKQI